MEIWKPVKNYEGLYEVSNLGVVKRIGQRLKVKGHTVFYHGRIMIPKDNGKGYLRIKLTKGNSSRHVMLHRIIAEVFIPNPNNYKTVNHINGNKSDNSIDNLEWCTQSENCKHAIRIGLHKFDNIPGSKVLCNKTGIVFNSIAKAAEYYKIDRGYLSERLNGKAINNTSMVIISHGLQKRL